MTKKVVEAMRHPAVRCLSHPKGRIINHRPPNALALERVIEVALAEGVALETNGLPDRLDLRDEDVRLASTRLVRGINAIGYPAISVPCGDSDGMPIGLQIVGRPFDETLLLRVAAAIEKTKANCAVSPPSEP